MMRRNTRRSSRDGSRERNVSNDSLVDNADIDRTDLISELSVASDKLKDRKQQRKEYWDSARTETMQLFQHTREILSRKENELIANINSMHTTEESDFNNTLIDIEVSRRVLLTQANFSSEAGGLSGKGEMIASLRSAENCLNQEMPVFSLNQSIVDYFENSTYGELNTRRDINALNNLSGIHDSDRRDDSTGRTNNLIPNVNSNDHQNENDAALSEDENEENISSDSENNVNVSHTDEEYVNSRDTVEIRRSVMRDGSNESVSEFLSDVENAGDREDGNDESDDRNSSDVSGGEGPNSLASSGNSYEQRREENDELSQNFEYTSSESVHDLNTELSVNLEQNGGVADSQFAEVIPSAPLLPDYDYDSPPPLYWQVVNSSEYRREISCPNDDRGAGVCTNYAPNSYTDSIQPVRMYDYCDLSLIRIIPVTSRYDRRQPLPVGLQCDNSIIYVADKANKKVTFFKESGRFIDEIQFGSEVYDVAFLGGRNGEYRFIAALPKEQTVAFIDLKNGFIPKSFAQIKVNRPYSSVCGGPSPSTLMGIDAVPRRGESQQLEVFDFMGRVIQVVTPRNFSFKYPRSLMVHESSLVVCDWKSNAVVVLTMDGTQLGLYTGTEDSPLVNPTDITLDSDGNIFVVCGQFSNIHVVDKTCNPLGIIRVPQESDVPGTKESPKLVAFNKEAKKLALIREAGKYAEIYSMDTQV